MSRHKGFGVAAALLLATQGTAAQEAAPADASPTPVETAPPAAPESEGAEPGRKASRVIEEIVVTAQKREENLADVPISVSAFSGEKLEALGVDGPIDLPQITPGLQYDSLVGYSVVYLRGVGTEIFLPNSDPSVATYIDGIYFPFSHGLATDFGKLERIEVLKGPQGTLFGRNSTGGAINIVTARPSRDRIEGTASYEIGEFNTRNLKGYVGGPLTNDIQAGISLIANEADSHYERPEDSQFPDFPKEKQIGLMGKLNWELSETMGLTLNGILTRQTGLYSVVTTSFDVKPLGQVAGVTESPKKYVTDPDDDIHFRASNEVGFGEFRWSPGPVNLKLLGSYQEITTDTSFDFEGSSADLINFHPKDQGVEITTGELQMLSEPGGFATFNDRFEWITGLYFFRSDNAGFRDLEVPVADGTIQLPTGGEEFADELSELVGLIGDTLNLFPLAGVPSGADLHLTAQVNTIAYAAFAQGTFDFTDRLALTVGARYQDEDRDLDNATTSILNADGSTTPLLNFPDDSQTAKKLSPKVTLDFRMADDDLIFASWQQGFKSGTFNIVNIYTVAGEVKPEKLTNYELGIKGTLADGTFRYSAGVFRNDIKNLQVLFISVQSGGAVTIENAGKARIKGADLDLLWQPLPEALPGLVLTASGAYLKGKYLSYENGSGFDPTTGLFFSGSGFVLNGGVLPGRDFSGNETVRTPKYTGNFGITYSFDALAGNFEVGGSVYYNDGYYFSAANNPRVAQPDYTLLNARISYFNEPSGLRLSVFGKNLGDELYWYNQFETDFNTIGTLAPGRAWGVRLDWQF